MEENWKSAGNFSGGKATLTGIVPGTTVWVRARTMGLRNVMGGWSENAGFSSTNCFAFSSLAVRNPFPESKVSWPH